MRAAYPSVRRLRTEVNLGISGGLNLGFRVGIDEGWDYLMPMNNDVEVAPDLLRELVASAAEANPTIGCIGPKCFYFFGDRNRLWSAGGQLRFRESVTRERGMGELDRGQYDRDGEVDYVNGALMLIRREAMLATGLWDPVYHVSVEDADWCVRMKRAGFRCWYAHRARLWHMVSPTTGGYTAGQDLSHRPLDGDLRAQVRRSVGLGGFPLLDRGGDPGGAGARAAARQCGGGPGEGPRTARRPARCAPATADGLKPGVFPARCGIPRGTRAALY